MIPASPEAINVLAASLVAGDPLKLRSKELRDLVAMEAEKLGWPLCEWESANGEFCVVRKVQVGLVFPNGQPRTLRGRYYCDE